MRQTGFALILPTTPTGGTVPLLGELLGILIRGTCTGRRIISLSSSVVVPLVSIDEALLLSVLEPFIIMKKYNNGNNNAAIVIEEVDKIQLCSRSLPWLVFFCKVSLGVLPLSL